MLTVGTQRQRREEGMYPKRVFVYLRSYVQSVRKSQNEGVQHRANHRDNVFLS